MVKILKNSFLISEGPNQKSPLIQKIVHRVFGSRSDGSRYLAVMLSLAAGSYFSVKKSRTVMKSVHKCQASTVRDFGTYQAGNPPDFTTVVSEKLVDFK